MVSPTMTSFRLISPDMMRGGEWVLEQDSRHAVVGRVRVLSSFVGKRWDDSETGSRKEGCD